MAEHELNKIVDDDGEVFNLRDSTKQPVADRVTSWGSTPSDTKYPSEKLVKDSLDKSIHLTNNPSDIVNGVSSSANSEILWQFSLPYFAPSGNNGIYILMYDVTAWYDGSHESYDGFAIFSGTFYVVKNTGYGGPVLAEISIKVSGKTERTVYLYSSTKLARPQIISRIENGVRKYYAAIYYGSSLYEKNAGLLGTWKWATSVVPNGFIGEVVSYATYPEGELYFDLEIDSSYFIDANTAVKLATSRTFRTNLGSTSTASFDGTANVTSGVTGTLPVGNGGTGKSSVTSGNYLVGNGTSALAEKTPNDAANDLINALSTGESTPTGDDYYVAQYAGGGTTTKTYHRRPVKALWEYIKSQISSVLGLTATSYGGNAATATALSAGADRTKLDGIADGAEVNVQSDWNQATTTADDYIKNKPTIPSGTQLVYDCGTGSTSTTDFDNALAAYNAGNWVIIHNSGNAYHCVGTYNSGLRFKQIANETASIKINTLNWTRGSTPSVGTQLEPSMPGHTHSDYVEKAGDAMSGNLTISKGANQGDTKFVTSRTDTGTTGWFGVGDGGQNHGVYSEVARLNTNNNVDADTKGWVVRTDENGYSSLTGAVNGLFAKDFGASETLRGMKMFKFGYSLDREGDYTHVSATAIIEVRIYYAGVAGSSITMLFNASARGDVGSYYRLQVLSYNNWNLNSVCPVLITREESATAKYMYLGLVSGGPTSTTLRTFNYTEVKVLPLNGTQKFNWSFGWNTNDFNSNTMTMIKPYVYPRAQIGTAIGDAGTPVYVKADGDFGTASGTDVAIALKDAGRADAPVTQDWRVKVGWGGSGVDACAPNGTSTYSAGQTVSTTKHLVTAYEYDGVGYYKDVQAGMVTVGNSERWNGYKLAIQNPGNTPAADTIYIF